MDNGNGERAISGRIVTAALLPLGPLAARQVEHTPGSMAGRHPTWQNGGSDLQPMAEPEPNARTVHERPPDCYALQRRRLLLISRQNFEVEAPLFLLHLFGAIRKGSPSGH